jgi:hypothetical protein
MNAEEYLRSVLIWKGIFSTQNKQDIDVLSGKINTNHLIPNFSNVQGLGCNRKLHRPIGPIIPLQEQLKFSVGSKVCNYCTVVYLTTPFQ